MLLTHAEAQAALHKEMIEPRGLDRAQGFPPAFDQAHAGATSCK